MRANLTRSLPILIACAAGLAGCDTQDELDKQKLEQLSAEESGLKDLKTFLGTSPNVQGAGAVNAFLSARAIDTILAAADGAVIPVEGADGVSIKIKRLRTSFALGSPSVVVDASAHKQGIDAAVDVSVAARIETRIDPAKPKELQLRVRLVSIVPRVTWGLFDFKLRGFVQDLIQVSVGDKLNTIGVISIPVATDIPLDLPAKQTSVTLPGAVVNVETPDLSLKATAALTRVITLPDGLHVLGTVTAL